MSKNEEKRINELVYKFLWNRDFTKEKAPNRIKRNILQIPIKQGGYGMLDHSTVIKSLQIRQVIRNLNGNHPVGSLYEACLNQRSYFKVSPKISIDSSIINYCEWLRLCRQNSLLREEWELESDLIVRTAFINEMLPNVINQKYQNSIEVTVWRSMGIRTVGDAIREKTDIARIMDPKFKLIYEVARSWEINDNGAELNWGSVYQNGKYVIAKDLRSRDVRSQVGLKVEIMTNSKFINLQKCEANQFFSALSKLSSNRNKCTMLNLLHGNVYTNERLARFGLRECNKCEVCGETETVRHRFESCSLARNVWDLLELHEKNIWGTNYKDVSHRTIGYSEADRHLVGFVTVHSEIIRRLAANYSRRLDHYEIVRQLLMYLRNVEKIKNQKFVNRLIGSIFPDILR